MRFSVMPSSRRPVSGQIRRAAAAGAVSATRCAVEALEDRQFLSASLAPAGVAITPAEAMVETSPLAGGYAGTMKFSKVEGVRPPSRTLFIDITSRSNSGAVSGTLVAAGVGVVDFTGQLSGRKVNLQWDEGGQQGYVIAKTNKSGTKLSATVLNVTAGTKAKVKAGAAEEVGRVLYASGQTVTGATATTLTTSAVAAGSMAGANPVVNLTGGTGNASYRARLGNPYQDASGELHFVGSYSGSVTVRTAPEVHGNNRPGPFSAAQTYSATMNIATESTSDLLTGTMVVSSLGNYNVTGVVKLDEMTLIVTPSGGTGGTGVMKLHVSRDGFTYSGRFEQEANDTWAFGTVTLTRPGAGTSTGTGGSGTGTGVGSGTGTGTGTGTSSGTGSGSVAASVGTVRHPELVNNVAGTGGTSSGTQPDTAGGTGTGTSSGAGTGTTTGSGTGTTGSTTGTGTTTGGVGTGTNIPPTSPFNPGTVPGTTPLDPVTVPSTPTNGGPIGNTPGVDVAGNPTTSPGGSGSGSAGTDIANPTNPTSPTTGTNGLPADGTGTTGATANGQTLPSIIG